MKLKVTIILLVIIAVITALVFLMLYGINRDNTSQNEAVLPSEKASTAYVLNHNLLKSVDLVRKIRVGGPIFMSLQGKDDQGNDKIVWLTGPDNRIENRGSILVKDALPKEAIYPKLQEKGVSPDQIEDMYLSPYDYISNRIVWFVRQKGVTDHDYWYDYKTGELIWEGVEDPTAWKL